VLEALLHKGPMTQSDLGRRVLTSAGNLTDVVDKLERRGCVRRARPPEDRRRVLVSLTDTGRRLITDLFPRHAEDIADAMGGLDLEQLRTLDALLRDLGHAAAALAIETAASHLPEDPSISKE
jgi:MarR family 2-MHQ and catechol resistance regulon transcriptional repressor